MRIKLDVGKGRMRDKIHIELEESEARAVANGIEVKVLVEDTWVLVSPSRNFLDKVKVQGTSGTSRKSAPRKRK